ncbi:MAG: leucine-rich repeat domain-containing protein, partial [Bacteroidota bacterium]
MDLKTPVEARKTFLAGYFPLENAFDVQPTWDNNFQSQIWGQGGNDVLAYGPRSGHLNFDGSHNFFSFTYRPQNDVPAVQGLVLDIDEIQALRDLYESTNGDNWTSQTDSDPANDWPRTVAEWDGITSIDQASNWHGVTITNSDVFYLTLHNNVLSGSLPSSLGDLKSLERLFLQDNDLSGIIPETLGDLSLLKLLQLYDNQLTGEIPESFKQLSKLYGLNLSHNSLTGVIPDSIVALTELEHLSLNNNQLTGTIPTSIGNLTKLDYLYLQNNQLTGSIPSSIENLSLMTRLYLHNNQLNGPIPAGVSQLSSLRLMLLQSNDFSGEIPNDLGALINLVEINLSHNQLTGVIPSSVGELTELVNLYLSHNQLVGAIPESLGNLAKLNRCYIHNNQLSGQLPSTLGNLSSLTIFYAYNNNLSQGIPEELVNLTALRRFYIQNNHFTSFPDFNAHPTPSNLIFNIHNNYIPQLDIDANLNPDGSHNFSSFIHSPQNEVPAEQGQILDIVELQALRDLYESTNGDNWTSQTDADPANDWPRTSSEWEAVTSVDQVVGWSGITFENGDITRLDLSTKNLDGTLPPSLNNLQNLN